MTTLAAGLRETERLCAPALPCVVAIVARVRMAPERRVVVLRMVRAVWMNGRTRR